MSQEYTPVVWVDETENQVGTIINKARLDQMQSAHHFADGFKEVDTVPTENPGVDYHMVVFCTADTTFYRWNGTQWVKDVDDSTLALLEAHEADHNNPHVVTKAQVGLGNVDNYASVSTWQDTPDNTHIPTEKLTKDSLDAKLDDSQLVTSWSGTVSNTNIPSEKLVKDSLDGKVDKLVTKPTAGTYTSVTINSEGQVTGGANPTTLAGYGIIDAVNTTGDQTGIAGAKTFLNQLSVKSNSVTQPYRFLNQNLPILRRNFGSVNIDNSMVAIANDDGEVFSDVEYKETANTARSVGIRLFSPTMNAWRGIELKDDGSSNTYVTCPTRTYNASNTNDIVTIGSLASNPSVVHTTGNETIAGNKTFTGYTFYGDANHYVTKYAESAISYLLMASQSPNATTSSRLYLRAGNDGTVTLVLGKWFGGNYSSTTIATL